MTFFKYNKTLQRLACLSIAIFTSAISIKAAMLGTVDKRPNILIIMADDLTYRDLAVYGGTNVATPNIDLLASKSMIFNRAYVSMAMCTPSRVEFLTGKYPPSTGVIYNHGRAVDGTKSMVHYLESEGYKVGIAGKMHIKPQKVFPFQKIEGVERRAVAPTAGFDATHIRNFFAASGPFCLFTAFTMPHSPWTVGNPENFDRQNLKLPPYLVDNEVTRTEYAKYLAEIEVLDQQIGQVLKTLEESGKADNTLILFTTEQGSQFPLNKWTNYEMGLHTGIMVRWPGRVTEGSRTNAMVQYADVLPTLLDVADVKYEPHDFDGTSFFDVLLHKKKDHRKFAYALHNNVPEGPPYAIRSITDGEYRYIKNLDSDKLFIEKHLMGKISPNSYWASWMFDSAKNEKSLEIVNKYMKRPEEELYHTKEDPFEKINLAKDANYSKIKERLSLELDKWMNRYGAADKEMDSWKAYRRSVKE
ncbi:sulfatase family protein [Sinomicrobium sp. M5D2P17]